MGLDKYKNKMKIKFILFLSFLGLVGIYLWSFSDKETKVVFCDVGQGDGTLVSRGNFQVLIDTGPSNKKMLYCLEKYIPFWDKEIEAVIISHWDKDHSGGLKEVGKSYEIKGIYSSNDKQGVVEQDIYSKKLMENDLVVMGEITYEVLNSGGEGVESNEGSLVGILSYGDKKILMTGDIPVKVEEKLIWRRKLTKEVDILKVSHHGSRAATSEELLEVIKPKTAIISVGKNNYGHPSKEVLDRLGKRGIEIRRTDESGDIVF